MTSLRPGKASLRGAGLAGLGAGVVALGCCVGPAVAVLLGLTSATVAIDVATDLYAEWGWAFKLAGLTFAVAAIGVARKRSLLCATKPRLMRFTAILFATAFVTYTILYVGSTLLGDRASASAPAPIAVRGSSIGAQVDSAITQVRDRYRDVTIDVEGASSSSVRFRIAFQIPDVDPSSEEYNEELSRRIGDSREATVLLLQSLATEVPSIGRFSVSDDLILVPTWSREQVLDSQDPQTYRDFDSYTRFVMSAETLSGYSRLQTDRSL